MDSSETRDDQQRPAMRSFDRISLVCSLRFINVICLFSRRGQCENIPANSGLRQAYEELKAILGRDHGTKKCRCSYATTDYEQIEHGFVLLHSENPPRNILLLASHIFASWTSKPVMIHPFSNPANVCSVMEAWPEEFSHQHLQQIGPSTSWPPRCF